MLKTSIITIITLLILISCVTSPLGRKQLIIMPASNMETMGIQAFQNLKQKTPIEANSSANNRYVNCIANAILQVSNSPKQWEIVVFREDSANAFALPGAKIGVHTGLLKIAKNQHQLAAVIGHEIAHVLAKHSNERASQHFLLKTGMALTQTLSQKAKMWMAVLGVGTQLGILLPYSRIHESEADEMGLYLMAKAGFDPRESVKLWQNMNRAGGKQGPEFLSTHPSHNTRITRLKRAMRRAMGFYRQATAKGKNPNCRL